MAQTKEQWDAWYAANRENRAAYNRKRRADGYRHPTPTQEQKRIYRVRYKETLAGRATSLLRQAHSRATKAKRPVTLTVDWIIERLVAGHCEATGFPFTFTVGKGHQTYTPSIDRIDSSRGYTPDNCRLVITAFNHGKNQWSDDILAGWARAFLKQYDSAH